MKDDRKQNVSDVISSQILQRMIDSAIPIVVNTNPDESDIRDILKDKMLGILDDYTKTSKVREKISKDMVSAAMNTVIESPQTPIQRLQEFPSGTNINLYSDILDILKNSSQPRNLHFCTGNSFTLKLPKCW